MSSDPGHSPRLYLDARLDRRLTVTLSPEQSHYLKNVMRLGPGGALRLFNGHDGEWRGIVGSSKTSKAPLTVEIAEHYKPQTHEPDLWLCAAPIRKAHFEYMIEKATELGVRAIRPVLTARTQIREVNVARMRGIAIEAAEQSERLSIPVIEKPVTLKELAAGWPNDRVLIVCAEWGEAVAMQEAFGIPRLKSSAKTAILTGPEGGLAAEELDMLRGIKNAVFIRLGPRILRADTAAIAALSCWQAMCGDWNNDSSGFARAKKND